MFVREIGSSAAMAVAASLQRGLQGTLLHKTFQIVYRPDILLPTCLQPRARRCGYSAEHHISAPFEAQVGKQRTAMTLLTAHCQPPEPGTSNIGRGVQQQVVLCILEVIASLAAEKQVQDASRCKQCIRRRYWSKEGSRKRATRPSQDILAIES